jgi:hypothetical protein
MTPRRFSRSATVLAAAAIVTCASPVAAQADSPPPGQVLSNFENYGANIVRDCGYSQPLPAHPSSSLWLFCDTDVYGSTRRATGR